MVNGVHNWTIQNYFTGKQYKRATLERRFGPARRLQNEELLLSKTDAIYTRLKKLVRGSRYDVSEYSEEDRQFSLRMKSSGSLVIGFPLDVAYQVAARSKETKVGLLVDMRI